jgi:presenilin-like A22 family membrane protease
LQLRKFHKYAIIIPLALVSDKKKSESRDLLPFFFMGCLFVVVQGLALLVAVPFEKAGAQVFVNPNDPFDLLYFLGSMLVLTALILLISKFWKKQFVQILVLGATALLMFYVFEILLSFVLPDMLTLTGVSVAAVALLMVLLVKYPEWYVIDATGILVGVGTIAMLGISLSIVLTIILLVALAIYDAISVYRTKHMIDLADTVMDLKLPIILLIPKKREYSLLKETKSLKQKLKEGEEREAFLVGLGDIVMPGILAVSAFSNLTNNGLLVALSVILGTLVGFAVLMRLVATGRPQAGLPLLCGGAISGYLISSFLLSGSILGVIALI